jgi:hypothetical protein
LGTKLSRFTVEMPDALRALIRAGFPGISDTTMRSQSMAEAPLLSSSGANGDSSEMGLADVLQILSALRDGKLPSE